MGWVILVSLQNCWVAAAQCSFYSQVLEVSSTIPVVCAANLALVLNRPSLSCPCVPVFLELCLLTCGFEMLRTRLVPTLLFLSIWKTLEFASPWGGHGEPIGTVFRGAGFSRSPVDMWRVVHVTGACRSTSRWFYCVCNFFSYPSVRTSSCHVKCLISSATF